METIYIWGVKFNPLSKIEFVENVLELLSKGITGIHLTGVNSETVSIAQKEKILQQAILDSDFVNIDNAFITLALRCLGYKIPERAATPDIFELFLQNANEKRQSVYFLGAEEHVVKKMVESIKKTYPNIIIAGYRNGFYTSEEEPKIAANISESAPTFLFLGLPTPMKESFILKYKKQINVGVLYGVGGAFDCKGGKVKRAPQWIGHIGLEGCFRVLQSPSNYGKRVLKYYPRFCSLFLKEIVNRIIKKTNK